MTHIRQHLLVDWLLLNTSWDRMHYLSEANATLLKAKVGLIVKINLIGNTQLINLFQLKYSHFR